MAKPNEVKYPHGAIVPSQHTWTKPNTTKSNGNKKKNATTPVPPLPVPVTPKNGATCDGSCTYVWTPNGWVFAYSTCPAGCGCPTTLPPTPEDPTNYGQLGTVTCEASSGDGCTCDCVGVCTDGSKNGFLVCFDGVCTLLNDYPASGGPWAPAFYPNGSVTWVNQGS